MAIVLKGDALQPDSVQKAFDQIEEVDAVVSTIGGTPADPAADSQVWVDLKPTCTLKALGLPFSPVGANSSRHATCCLYCSLYCCPLPACCFATFDLLCDVND